MSPADPYAVLGLSGGATREDVRRAYRKLARKHHPDANPNDPEAEARFKEIQHAYETLSKPGKSPSHERRNASGGSSASLSDLIEKLSHDREGQGEDAARILKLFGLDANRISKFGGENARIKVSFGKASSGRPPKPRGGPPVEEINKPPKPPKPPDWGERSFR